MKVPEQYRLRNHPVLGSDRSYGTNGFFIIPHNKIDNFFYNCQVSDGEGWQHVSITLTKHERVLTGNGRRTSQLRIKAVERCCTWEEMCYVKSVFWNDDEAVIQIHPPKLEYVNMHKYCLHLWKPNDAELPLPDSLLIGLKATA